ncbi:MAG: hypothetical protein EOO45_10525 [Flavobacterium sp.]|nr:MAG: hypothetical protein EOO45_10525 [Flavobacterium sp.]
MINIIIWVASLLCPNPTHTIEFHGSCELMHVTSISSSSPGTGGELGGLPKPPFPPPPPPPGGGE